MFIRRKTVRHGEKTYIYQDVVRSVRVKGEPRQELIASLGRVRAELSPADQEELLRVLEKHYRVRPPAPPRGPTPSVLDGLPAAEGDEALELGEGRSYGGCGGGRERVATLSRAPIALRPGAS